MRFAVVGLMLCAAGAAAEPGSEAGAEVGAMFRKNCAPCHVVPDKTLKTDLAWLDQIHRTTWTSIKPKARAALIEWLKAQKVAPKVDTPPAVDAKPAAWIEPAFDAGSVVLKSGDRLVRVVWPLGDKDKRRVIAPGKYTVRELRFEHRHEGAHWFLSSSGPPFQKVEVAAKGATKLVIPDEITCATKAKRNGDHLNLSFGMHAKNGHGITIFRNDRRVPVTYRLIGKDGEELAAGKMNYGWGGVASASVKLPPNNSIARVEVVIDVGPIRMKGPRGVDLH